MFVQEVVGICFPWLQKWILDPAWALTLTGCVKDSHPYPIPEDGGPHHWAVTMRSLFARRGALRGSRRGGQQLPGEQPLELTPGGQGGGTGGCHLKH